MKMVAKMNII